MFKTRIMEEGISHHLDWKEVIHQLQIFRQVLDQVRETNEKLVSAVNKETRCDAFKDDTISSSFKELQGQIQHLGTRLDKRDEEIQVLQETLTSITFKVDETVKLVEKRSTGNVRIRKSRKRAVHKPETNENISQASCETENRCSTSVCRNTSSLEDTEYRPNFPDKMIPNFQRNINSRAPDAGLASKEPVPNIVTSEMHSPRIEDEKGKLRRSTRSHKSKHTSSYSGTDERQNVLFVKQNDSNNIKNKTPSPSPTQVQHQQSTLSDYTRQHPLPALTKDGLGFRRRLTQEKDDNRVTFLRENPNPEVEYGASGGTETGNAEKTPEKFSNFSTAFKDFLEMEGDKSLAEIGFREWFRYAEDEKNKGSVRRLRRGRGPDTVICLDTSGSMAGEPFRTMISVAVEIVQGIQQVRSNLPIPENVSVTTFGGESKVAIHLTDNYDDVITTIRNIPQPKGPSPIAGGLLVALAGCLGNGTTVFINNLVVGTRVILISDGKGTPDHLRIDHDYMQMDMAARVRAEANLTEVALNLRKRHVKVFCIPVGDANIVTLKKISHITYGKICSRLDIPRVVRHAQNLLNATEIVRNNPVDENADPRPIYSAAFVEVLTRPEEKEDVVDIAVSLHKSLDGAIPEEEQTVERFSYLPPLGTRVCRGPAWHYGNQDTNEPGTIYNHGKNGMLWVEWDNGHSNCYHYSQAIKDVVEVDSPRILGNDDLIAVGCQVKKGQDWQGDQEVGDVKVNDVGTVIKVRADGIVHVRWPNKKIGRHSYGAEGCFELMICGENEVKTPKTMKRPSRRHVAVSNDEDLRIESFLQPP